MTFDKALISELHVRGFKRTLTFPATQNTCGTAIYEKTYSDRKLEVQLWGDGGHRVSHWHTGISKDHFGVMDTYPTNFSTLEEMQMAIKHEETRTDWK